MNKRILTASMALILSGCGHATVAAPAPTPIEESIPAWTELTEEDMLLNLAAAQREDGDLAAETQQHCMDPVSAWVEEVSEGISLDYGPTDAYLLAKIAYAEARGEGVEGQALVIRVVLNRVYSDAFPDTIEAVIMQEGQFAGIKSDAWQVEELPADTWAALELVESGWDESRGATYFESIALAPENSWHKLNLQKLFEYGGHTFFCERR